MGDRKLTNQIANFALLEWPDNAKAGARAPVDYLPDLRQVVPNADWAQMYELHALPPDWETLDYHGFLSVRRKLMADIIRRGFEAL